MAATTCGCGQNVRKSQAGRQRFLAESSVRQECFVLNNLRLSIGDHFKALVFYNESLSRRWRISLNRILRQYGKSVWRSCVRFIEDGRTNLNLTEIRVERHGCRSGSRSVTDVVLSRYLRRCVLM